MVFMCVHGCGFGVDADDGLGVGFAEVNPAVGEVDLYAVDIGDALVGVTALYGVEDSIDIDGGGELDLVFGDGIRGISGLEFADLLA